MKVEVTLAQAGQVVAFVFLVLSGMALLGWVFARVRRMDGPTTGAAVMAATFFNAVTLGFPFVLFAFGEEGLRLAAVLVATNSLPHNACGLFLAARGLHGTRQSLWKLARMPVPYAILAALFLRAFEIPLPASVFEPIDILGRAGIPVLLITIGMEVGRIPLRMNHPDTWGVVALRLLVGPLLGLVGRIPGWLGRLVGSGGGACRQACLRRSCRSFSLENSAATSLSSQGRCFSPRSVQHPDPFPGAGAGPLRNGG